MIPGSGHYLWLLLPKTGILLCVAGHVAEPIIPPKSISKPDVETTYFINIFQSAAQMAVKTYTFYSKFFT